MAPGTREAAVRVHSEGLEIDHENGKTPDIKVQKARELRLGFLSVLATLWFDFLVPANGRSE
jgi:hypothetical protein